MPTLYALARRLYADFDELAEPQRAVIIGDLLGALYTVPLVMVSVVWLAVITELPVIQEHWPLLLLLLGIKVLLSRLRFVIWLELRPGIPAYSENTLEDMIDWSSALILGPTALWMVVIRQGVELVHQMRQNPNTAQRWQVIRNRASDVSGTLLSSLAALALYTHWGGAYPPAGLTLDALWPALAATLVRIVLEVAIQLPFLLYISRHVLNIVAAQSQSVFVRFLAITITLPNLIDPFAVLAALLYGDAGIGAYLYLIAGALLTGLLAHQLSVAVDRSRQRSRELDQLEQLGRALIGAPPDGSALDDLLSEHLPGMFGFSALEIRLFAQDTPLYQSAGMNPIDTALWDWARTADQPHVFKPGQPLPWQPQTTARSGHVYVPVRDHDTQAILGGIYLLRPFDPANVGDVMPALQSLAGQVSSALHNARVYQQTLAHQRVEQELAFAGEIQASFLPASLPTFADHITDWKIVAALESARQTSGDFYDLIDLPGDRLGIVVADVADKGTGAALFMALSRTLIRTFAFQDTAHPAQVLAAANARMLSDAPNDLFVTVFYGILDLTTGHLAYCNAGHNPPLLSNGTNGQPPLRLERTGIPLGLFDSYTWGEKSVEVTPGTALVLYSDGVTEAENEQGDFFGEERINERLRMQHAEAPDLHQALLADLNAFMGNAPQADDITLLVVTRH